MTWDALFENLKVSDLCRPYARISWSAPTLKTILAFCAEHQVSDHNRPTPEQLVQLLNSINAPITSDVDSWKAAGMKTLACIASRTAQLAKVGDVLKEVKGKDGVWVCRWSRYSLLWTAEEWDGETEIVVENLSSVADKKLLGEWRPVVARRHELGHKRLVDAAAHLQQKLIMEGGAEKEEKSKDDKEKKKEKDGIKEKDDSMEKNMKGDSSNKKHVMLPSNKNSSPAATNMKVTFIPPPLPRMQFRASPVATASRISLNPSAISTDSDGSFMDFFESPEGKSSTDKKKKEKEKKMAMAMTSHFNFETPDYKSGKPKGGDKVPITSSFVVDTPQRNTAKAKKASNSDKVPAFLSPPATPGPRSPSPFLPASATAPSVESDDWLNI